MAAGGLPLTANDRDNHVQGGPRRCGGTRLDFMIPGREHNQFATNEEFF
jgi:hypothetical protein